MDRPLVIDNGSGLVKAGYAGRSGPSATFPSVIGIPDHPVLIYNSSQSSSYIGDDAQNYRGILTLKYPIQRGIIIDWDDMETIWHHTFAKELHVDPSNHSLLLTETALNPKSNREMMAEIMFEKFDVPALHIALQSVLAIYSAGRTTATVLDSGDGVTHTIPVYEGYAVRNAIERMDFAGQDVTDCLRKLLNERGYQVSREIARTIKEKSSFVCLEYKAVNSSCFDETFELPDGNLVTIGEERFRCTEPLFRPALAGIEGLGLHEMLYKTIMKSDIDMRKDLFMNIVLAGGNTKICDLDMRLEKEIIGLYSGNARVRVCSPPERGYSVWLGGSILAGMGMFRQICTSARDYAENGPSVVYKLI